MRNIASGFLVLIIAASADADLVAHNGTGAPNGTGQVGVDLTFGNGPGVVKVRKIFSENAEHALSYEWDHGEPSISWNETIVNDTGVAWTDYHLTMFGADFFGATDNTNDTIGGAASETNPVQTMAGMNSIYYIGPSGLASSEIHRGGDIFDVSSLWIFFDDPIESGEVFELLFFVNVTGELKDGFRLMQGPSPVPAPGAALLAAMGFGFVGWAKRRLA